MSVTPPPISTNLIDLLETSIVLRRTSPYLTVRDFIALSATCRALHIVFNQDVDAWRHLDLCHVKAAGIGSCPIDDAGQPFGIDRTDADLTEDDFYARPLHAIFGRLQQKAVLRFVQTLILDGLSVPAKLVTELLCDARYNVKILSIRGAKNLNMTQLQQALRYAVRPTRAERTPRLKALYVFGPKDPVPRPTRLISTVTQNDGGITTSEGAQIGALWNQKSADSLSSTHWDEETKWYGPTGRALGRQSSEWPETLHVCANIIMFDAVLCRGPRHDITKVDSKDFLQPAIASIALGPKGCESCGTCPETPAIFGQCAEAAMPLLGPPPMQASTVRAAQRPIRLDNDQPAKLILRCEECLKGRWCERCNRWWCEDCYRQPTSRSIVISEEIQGSAGQVTTTTGVKTTVKVYSNFCVEHCLVSEMMIGAGSNGMWG